MSHHTIDLRTVPGGYQVWVTSPDASTPLVLQGTKGVEFDRRAVGLRVKKGYRPPEGVVAVCPREDAIHLAHVVGRYVLGLGDMVFAYATVDGRRREDFFND